MGHKDPLHTTNKRLLTTMNAWTITTQCHTNKFKCRACRYVLTRISNYIMGVHNLLVLFQKRNQVEIYFRFIFCPIFSLSLNCYTASQFCAIIILKKVNHSSHGQSMYTWLGIYRSVNTIRPHTAYSTRIEELTQLYCIWWKYLSLSLAFSDNCLDWSLYCTFHFIY